MLTSTNRVGESKGKIFGNLGFPIVETSLFPKIKGNNIVMKE